MSSPPTSGSPDRADGVFGITVAARLVGTGVQNLRAYERAGLIEPARTPGGTRLYSQDDVDRLRRVDALLREGLNLAGIAMVLDLQDANALLRDDQGRRPSSERRRMDSAGPPTPGS